MPIRAEGSDLLMRLMSSASMRRDVLSNNIASQNLPGFRRRDVQFEELLARALDKGASREEVATIDPEVVVDFNTPARADGNNVAAERESSLMTENRVRFELYANDPQEPHFTHRPGDYR